MKKRFMTALIVLFTLVFSLAIFAACGGDDEGGLELNFTTVTIGVGDNSTVVAKADGKSVTWESSDNGVVSIVTQNAARGTCTFRGVSKGTATLTAKADSGASATCTVTVEDVTIELSATSLTILRKADLSFESKTLTATVMRNGSPSSGTVTWRSSDESVVTVKDGVLTAHKNGSATITASLSGGSAKATCQVNVEWEGQNIPDGWYEVEESGLNGALEAPGVWTWSGFQGTDDVHPTLYGEGSTATGGASFTVSGNTGWRWYGAQLFYKHPGTEANALVAGTVYKLTFKLDSTADGAITVNDTDVEVRTGTQNVEVIYREAGGDSASVTIALATHDKIRNNVNPIGQYKEGTLTISDMKWEVYAAQTLHAPTAFSVADDGELLITDDNNDSTFEGYVIGFFKAGNAEPSYTQPIMKPVAGRDILETMDVRDGKMYLDDSFVEAGDYILKVRAYCGTALYAASPWSTATVSRTVTHENGVEYDVLQSYRDVDRGIGRYYVWSEWGQYDLDGCTFKDNSLTLTLTGEASWYSNQVYYDIPGLEVNHLYEYQFTFEYDPASTEGNLEGRQFVINGQRLNVTSEAQHTYTIYFLYTGGLGVTMLLGQPTADWQGTVEEGGLPGGTYTFSDITLRDMNKEGNGVMIFGDYTDPTTAASSAKDQLVLWYAAIGDWAEWKATIDMHNISYEVNPDSDTGYSYTFDYDITPIDDQICNWIFRLWYKKSQNITGTRYKLELVLDSSSEGDININGQIVHLTPGEKTYTVYYVETETDASLAMSMATDSSMMTDEVIKIKSLKWTEGGAQGDDSDAMIFGDNLDGLTDKFMYWYATKGDYTEWKATMVMNSFSCEENPESDTGYSYTFDYDITPIDGQICNWIVRFWYKRSANITGAQYKLVLVLDSSSEGDVKINGQVVHLTPGEKTYTVYYVEGGASLEMSMATDSSMMTDEVIKIKSLKWTEGSKTPLTAPTGSVTAAGIVTINDPNNGTGVDHAEVGLFQDNALIFSQTIASGNKIAAGQYQNGEYTIKIRLIGTADYQDTDWVEIGEYTVTDGYDLDSRLEQDTDHAADHPGQWYHWLDHWDWEGSTAKATKSVIDMNAKTFTFGFTTEGTPRLGFGVQLYYKNPGNVNGKTYTFTANITLSVDGTITVNNQQVTLKAGEKTPVSIRYSESNLSISIQTGVYQGTPVMNGEITISDWNWTEIASNPNGDVYDLVPTTLEEGQIPADSTFYYYSEYGQMTEAKFDHGSISFKLGGKGNWYSDQIYYNSAAFAKDGTYTLKLKIHSTVAGKIRVNGTIFDLVVGDNDIEVTGTNGMFSIQMGAPGTNADGSTNWGWGSTDDSVENGEFTLSDFSWTAADGTVYGLDGKIS